MKHLLPLLLLIVLLIPSRSNAQLPDGATAPDWTLTDIFGNTHHLYDLLDQGKMVVIEFSATWCGPCWNYMQTGALEQFWDEHGPNGDNQAQVFYIEADQNTTLDDLYGIGTNTQGNWVANIPFPIIDLQVGENTDNQYQITYYPTLYAVCSDKKCYELGQVPASEWEEFITSCSLTAEVANVEDAVCYGDGAITLDVSGGINPITYTWSNGSHSASLTNVGAGTYSVTVLEANGKNAILEDIVITGADNPISLAFSDIEDALCFESATGNVSIELEDGVAPYTYDWSNGSHSQNLSNVVAGTYTVNATDSHGCPFEETFQVSEPDELLATYETTPDYCDLGNGTAALQIEGGVGNYDLTASQGNVVGDLIIDLYAGSVIATVEDGNGCIWEESIDIEFVPEPDVYFSPDPTITCVQPIATVTGYVQSGTGSGDYEYEWSTTNGHIVGATNQSAVQVDQEGDYSLTVYDLFSGCQVANEVAVQSTQTPPPVAAGDDSPISCEDLEPELQGSGDPGYVINWTTTNGLILAGGNTYVPTVGAAGLYVIHVTNPANSCTNLDSVTVVNNISPASAEYQYQTSGLTMIGTDLSTGSNLSGWTWSFGDGNTSTDPNTVHTFASEGTYEVCLSVQNGCGTSNTCHQVQVISSGSTISVIADVQNVLCNSDSTGSIALQVNGGNGNYTYAWTGPDGSTYNTPAIDTLIAGLYTLVVSDDQGNLFIGDFTVTEPTPIILDGSTIVDNLCFGQANGSLGVNISGGVLPYSYSFNGGPLQAENVISNLPAGVVDCAITDANGCPFVAGPYTIQEPPALTPVPAVTGVRCFAETNGAISLVVNGGVAPYSYLWDFGAQTTPDISGLPAGVYTCAVTDHNGCLSQVPVVVTQPEALIGIPTQIVDASGTEQNNGSISIDVLGGTAPYVVTWNNGATGTSITGLIPGEYWYIITDANGCVGGNTSPVVVNGITSTTKVEWADYISIVPNPSKGDVVVSWNGLTEGKGTMTLVTLEGKRLQSRAIVSGSGTWDLSGAGLSNGVYIVLVEINKQIVPFKLVVL
ncbi:MAG: T9SS type A sorting domain-containing protein [Saprospiraceae bacterium]|nr:T9SS type A sorting domain-containing protein [Candidatus Opimibacter iunctus]